MGSNNFKNSMIRYMDRDQENLNFLYERNMYVEGDCRKTKSVRVENDRKVA